MWKTLVIFVVLLGGTPGAFADTLCQETAGASKDRVTSRTGGCRGSERLVMGAVPNPFGNQANGSLIVETDHFLSDPQFMYSSIVVRAGATLTVTSGTVLRSRGGITINGTLSVGTGAIGGRRSGLTSDTIAPAFAPPHPGISAGPAGSGEITSSTADASGGSASDGHNAFRAANFIHSFYPWGGGGGAPARGEGGDGGGSIYLLGNDVVAIGGAGRILADGDDAVVQTGAGGGGGGFVVLASKTRINILAGAQISATGGDGGSALDSTLSSPTMAIGGGGGGGGGLVMLAAPRLSQLGAITVNGGAAGDANFSSTSAAILVGGGAGGSAGGNGGAGASVSVDPDGVGDATAGNSGWVISFETDPTDLF